MATPRRQSNEPVKILSNRIPWSLYQAIESNMQSTSINQEIVRLLQLAVDREAENRIAERMERK